MIRRLLIIATLLWIVALAVEIRDARAECCRWDPVLEIPRLGVHERLAANVDSGPVRWYRDSDTTAIAGHRTTHSAPFRNLHLLRPGDTVRLNGRTFRVKRVLSVLPTETWILNFKGLVLTTCNPAGSDRYRLVVMAKEMK